MCTLRELWWQVSEEGVRWGALGGGGWVGGLCMLEGAAVVGE